MNPTQFDIDIAMQRIRDWGFEVLGHDKEGITVKMLIGHYDCIETLKEICRSSGIKIKTYYFIKDGVAKIVWKYKWELKKEGVI